jgi:hypothetical protein
LSALSKVEKSADLESQVESLKEQVSSSLSKIERLETGDKYMTELLVQENDEMMCKFHKAPESLSFE